VCISCPVGYYISPLYTAREIHYKWIFEVEKKRKLERAILWTENES
jgi:hypothetical protein